MLPPQDALPIATLLSQRSTCGPGMLAPDDGILTNSECRHTSGYNSLDNSVAERDHDQNKREQVDGVEKEAEVLAGLECTLRR